MLLRHEIIHFFQPAEPPVVEHLFHTTFRFAEQHCIGMTDRIFGVQHRGDTAEHHLFATPTEFFGNSPAAFHLCAQHHRNGNQVARIVEIDSFNIFVRKRHVNIFGQRGRKHYRPVRRQVKRRLTFQFFPAGIY